MTSQNFIYTLMHEGNTANKRENVNTDKEQNNEN